MKKKNKISNELMVLIIAGMMVIAAVSFVVGYYEGMLYSESKQFEHVGVDQCIRFIDLDNNTMYQYRPLFYSDGSFACWEVTLIDYTRTYIDYKSTYIDFEISVIPEGAKIINCSFYWSSIYWSELND